MSDGQLPAPFKKRHCDAGNKQEDYDGKGNIGDKRSEQESGKEADGERNQHGANDGENNLAETDAHNSY